MLDGMAATFAVDQSTARTGPQEENGYVTITCDPYEVTFLPRIGTLQTGQHVEPEVQWECEMDESIEGVFGISYRFSNLPDSDFFEREGIVSGYATVTLSARVNKSELPHSGGTLEINLDAPIHVVDHLLEDDDESDSDNQRPRSRKKRRRRGLAYTSTPEIRTALMIRASGLDTTPSVNVSSLAEATFGYRGPSLASQYRACSGGALQFIPASGANITKGVLDVVVPYNVRGMYRDEVHNLVFAEAANHVGSLEEFDNVLVILPPGVAFVDAIAYAKTFGWYTVYQNEVGTKVAATMHEVGHNFGMKHSGEGNVPYEDGTCYMGQVPHDSLMCFNGAKSWYMNWYNDSHATIFPDVNPWVGKLASINDYVNGETATWEHSAVAKIETTVGSRDLYLLYNRKEGINQNVTEYPEMVTVVEAVNTGQVSGQSSLLAAVGPFQEFRISNFSGREGSDLVVRVCGLVFGSPDYANVYVYFDDEPPTASPMSIVDDVVCPCESSDECNDNNPCTIDECMGGVCRHFDVICPENIFLVCHVGTCDLTNGECVYELDPTCIWPSAQPSLEPSLSMQPSVFPSDQPSVSIQPSVLPSDQPSLSSQPSQMPSQQPSLSVQPSSVPSTRPSLSQQPSGVPSDQPSLSVQPSLVPSNAPSISMEPSLAPSFQPSISMQPSVTPSSLPSLSSEPSQFPTQTPQDPTHLIFFFRQLLLSLVHQFLPMEYLHC